MGMRGVLSNYSFSGEIITGNHIGGKTGSMGYSVLVEWSSPGLVCKSGYSECDEKLEEILGFSSVVDSTIGAGEALCTSTLSILVRTV